MVFSADHEAQWAGRKKKKTWIAKKHVRASIKWVFTVAFLGDWEIESDRRGDRDDAKEMHSHYTENGKTCGTHIFGYF